MLLILLQIAWSALLIVRVSSYISWINDLFYIVGLLAVLGIINNDISPSYKIVWITMIFIFPMFGVLIYLLYGNKKYAKVLRGKFEKSENIIKDNLVQDEYVLSSMTAKDRGRAEYLRRGGFPVYDNTRTRYFRSGEELWRPLLSELEKAEHYIFLEYFIIGRGKVWDSILDILVRKAAAGVDVRLIFDDVGCLSKIPFRYTKKLASLGIKARVFNPFVPFVNVVMNNRDHRKILVIDGHTAFTGGINLSDEYMNLESPYGYWKDTAVMLQGAAVWNFTFMFLQMWRVLGGAREENAKFHPSIHYNGNFSGEGFVQAFGDSPLDDESISQNVIIDIISHAEKYVYITTPYLVIDDQMKGALTLAAKRGVDVRIITPGIPDKKLIFRLTRSNYAPLLRAGVKIYEYTPGFIHAKSVVCDDETALVGTINLDYRSLYLHFECGVLISGTDTVKDVRADTLACVALSKQVDEKALDKNVFRRLFDAILRTLAPML